MKIKTRQQRLNEYNAKYPDRYYDPEKSLRQYFKSRNWDIEKASKKASMKLKKIEACRRYETIRILLYEFPMKTDRPRGFKNHTFSPNAAANHMYMEKAIKQLTKTLKLINTPAEIQIDAYLEMPDQVKPDEVILYEAKVLDVETTPDYDNIGKCYTDMLKDILITDDDIFHTGIIRKFYSVLPRVEIRITYITKHESDYIYKKLRSRKSIKEGIKNGTVVLDRLEYNEKS